MLNFSISWQILAHFDFDLKKVETGQQKAGKVTAANQKQMEEHFTTNQVNNMTEYKRNISERQNLLDVKMDRGSPVCNKLNLKTVEQFQKNVPQHKLAKTLKIHHLQYIISSKDPEDQEECLCGWHRAEGQTWMWVIVRGPETALH